MVYATKYGATAEIAEKIGEVLRQAGLPTDVLPVKQVDDLTPYTAIILGSAVYIGKWRKEAAKRPIRSWSNRLSLTSCLPGCGSRKR